MYHKVLLFLGFVRKLRHVVVQAGISTMIQEISFRNLMKLSSFEFEALIFINVTTVTEFMDDPQIWKSTSMLHITQNFLQVHL